ncbi:MAG: tetratricopeptide repeat protein, partial [Planctomycetaceae bacterium]
EGDGEMSVRVFEQLLAQPGLADPARVTTLFRISIAYEMIDNLEAAGRAAEEALKFNRNNPQLLARLAAVEILQGAYDKAEARLIEAISVLEAAPPSGPGRKEVVERLADVRSRLAGLYGRIGSWSRAVEQYQTVIQMEGLTPEQLRVPKMLLSNAMVQDGDTDGGVAILEELYESDPTDKGLNNDLGYLYADLGRNLEKAENMIRLAVEAEPDNPAYLDSLGWVLFRLGRNEEALEVMKKANAVPDYEDATLLEHQGDIHKALGQQQEAARLWQRALEVEQDSAGPNAEIVERLEKKLKD